MPEPPAGAQGRAGTRQQQRAAAALEKLRLQVAPRLEPRPLQTQADGGADIAQLLVRHQ